MAAMIPEGALSSGKPMPRIGLGTASFPFGSVDPAVVREAVLRAVEAGYRHFDTAAVYGTEALLGEAAAEAARSGLVSSRGDLYITSKLWLRDAHPGRVVPALRKTLQNLKMEYVDMYLIHFPVSMKPAEEWQTEEPSQVLAKEDLVMMDMQGVWEGMEEGKRLGLARDIGVSNFSCKKLETLLSFAVTPPAVNQVEVNPHCRQHKVREFCKEKGIRLCGYSPLGGKGAPWANNSVMDCPVLEQIARDRGKTIAQICRILLEERSNTDLPILGSPRCRKLMETDGAILASFYRVCLRWVYEQDDCIIVKSFNEKRLRENLGVFDWELTDDDRHKISVLFESRGTRDFFVHESGPYKTDDEFWDGEITGTN